MSARLLFLLLAWVFATSSALAADADVKATQEKDGEESLSYLAIIDGEEIPIGEYVSALRRGMRERFYHGTIPEEEKKKFYKEVADDLIQHFLLVREARRRNIQPDADAVEAAVTREEQVKAVERPTEKALKEFYESNKALFTTPERVKVSLILLRVDPASTGEVWQQASEEASAIVARLTKGADFAELARIHSSDDSAQNGGDMGYTHSGMLGDAAQKVLDIMEVGDISAPVMMLEGVAVFRLDDRVTPELNPFDAVRERAEQLYMREMGEKIEVNDTPWR